MPKARSGNRALLLAGALAVAVFIWYAMIQVSLRIPSGKLVAPVRSGGSSRGKRVHFGSEWISVIEEVDDPHRDCVTVYRRPCKEHDALLDLKDPNYTSNFRTSAYDQWVRRQQQHEQQQQQV